jgi:hypothetical protein
MSTSGLATVRARTGATGVVVDVGDAVGLRISDPTVLVVGVGDLAEVATPKDCAVVSTGVGVFVAVALAPEVAVGAAMLWESVGMDVAT